MESGSVFVIGSVVASCSAYVEGVPNIGESISAQGFVLELGGKGFNLLAGVHRLGAKVDGILPVGDDLFGRMVPQMLSAVGLPDDLVWVSQGQSGGGVGLIQPDGETRVAVHSGANGRLDAQTVRGLGERIAAADWIAAQFETSLVAIEAAFDLAVAAGRRTLLNPSPYQPIPEAILSRTHVMILNQTEAAALARDMGVGDAQEGLAQALMAKGGEAVILTLGSAGAVVWCGQGRLDYCAYEIEAMDALGAGDGFSAGLLTGLAEGLAVEEAMGMAMACGALVASRKGVLQALPSRIEVESFLATAHKKAPTP